MEGEKERKECYGRRKEMNGALQKVKGNKKLWKKEKLISIVILVIKNNKIAIK